MFVCLFELIHISNFGQKVQLLLQCGEDTREETLVHRWMTDWGRFQKLPFDQIKASSGLPSFHLKPSDVSAVLETALTPSCVCDVRGFDTGIRRHSQEFSKGRGIGLAGLHPEESCTPTALLMRTSKRSSLSSMSSSRSLTDWSSLTTMFPVPLFQQISSAASALVRVRVTVALGRDGEPRTSSSYNRMDLCGTCPGPSLSQCQCWLTRTVFPSSLTLLRHTLLASHQHHYSCSCGDKSPPRDLTYMNKDFEDSQVLEWTCVHISGALPLLLSAQSKELHLLQTRT